MSVTTYSGLEALEEGAGGIVKVDLAMNVRKARNNCETPEGERLAIRGLVLMQGPRVPQSRHGLKPHFAANGIQIASTP